MKPIHLYGHEGGPNPWKVVLILEELNIPYELEFVEWGSLHTPSYEKINPNGRVPAIIDPNTSLTLWESGAIINYLIETYDDKGKLQAAPGADRWHAQQWLFFQVSGQGPYFGQLFWFTKYHPDKVPSVIERYRKEIRRVTKVLDSALQGKEYLVGNKATFADLSFITWFTSVPVSEPEFYEELKEANPNFKAWMQRLMERPAVKKTLEGRDKALAASKPLQLAK